MPTIQESLDDLVANTTSLTNTVSGRITDMDGKITQANSAQVAAETAKTNAEIAKTSAQTAQSLAETARDVAATAKVDAQTAKSDSLAAQSAASSAQTSAEAARDASIAADVSASTNKSASITAKNAAVVAQGLAETAETNAATSAAAANSHKIKAAQWADAAEDTEVETGVYSAKHYMAKAAIENTAAGVSENNALASKNAASASAGTATTKASEASASATASAGSASTASTKAGEASSSASTASTQAGISTTKASEAAASASAAASSASSASSAATTAVNAVIDTAPANLNTLNELAAALGDDANYASTTTAALGNRYTKSETDAKIVELAPATDISGKLDKSGGTMTGSLIMDTNAGIASTTSNQVIRVLNPGNASLEAPNGTVGAIRILIPPSGDGEAPMMTIKVQVYEYISNESFELNIGGHFDSSSGWYNVFAYASKSPLMTQKYAVRFGRTASNQQCIYIGETSTNWSYPQVTVTEVTAGYVATSANWVDDWNISTVTAFETVHTTKSADDVFGSAGKVLQVREFRTNTTTTTTSSSSVPTALLMTFTPKSDDSSLLVQFSFTGYCNSSALGVEFDVFKNNSRMNLTGGEDGHSFIYNNPAGHHRYESQKIQFLDNVSSTAPVLYRLYTQLHSGSGSAGIQSSWGSSSLVITEIKND